MYLHYVVVHTMVLTTGTTCFFVWSVSHHYWCPWMKGLGCDSYELHNELLSCGKPLLYGTFDLYTFSKVGILVLTPKPSNVWGSPIRFLSQVCFWSFPSLLLHTYWTISSSRVQVLLWCLSPNWQFLVSWSLFLLGFLRFVWNLDAWALLRCFKYGLFLKVATTNYLKTNVSILISKVKMLTLVFMMYASLEFASNPLVWAYRICLCIQYHIQVFSFVHVRLYAIQWA